MKKKEKAYDPLKLMRWANDGFCPIDLNENFMYVIELIREIKSLRHELKQLQNEQETVH